MLDKAQFNKSFENFMKDMSIELRLQKNAAKHCLATENDLVSVYSKKLIQFYQKKSKKRLKSLTKLSEKMIWRMRHIWHRSGVNLNSFYPILKYVAAQIATFYTRIFLGSRNFNYEKKNCERQNNSWCTPQQHAVFSVIAYLLIGYADVLVIIAKFFEYPMRRYSISIIN